MAQIRAIEARGLLDEIAQGAINTGNDLITALRAAKSAVLTPSFKQGKVFINTSGNGQSASFLIPSAISSDFTPTRIAAQFQEFIEIYNDCIAQGLITDTSLTESDAAVMAQDDRLQTVTHQRLDVTGIRWPGSGVQVA